MRSGNRAVQSTGGEAGSQSLNPCLGTPYSVQLGAQPCALFLYTWYPTLRTYCLSWVFNWGPGWEVELVQPTVVQFRSGAKVSQGQCHAESKIDNAKMYLVVVLRISYYP